jgi:death-on-curing protein
VTDYLNFDDLLAAADAAVGGAAEIRDVGLLQSAIARPQAMAFGGDAYPDLDQKAAAVLHAIVGGDPLLDGNERLRWVATRLFYRMNGADLRADEDDAFELVVSIAGGELRGVPAIAGRLAQWRIDLG